MKRINLQEVTDAYWKGRNEADSPIDEGAGWGAIAQLDADREEVKEIFEKIESKAMYFQSDVVGEGNLYINHYDWQALKQKHLGG